MSPQNHLLHIFNHLSVSITELVIKGNERRERKQVIPVPCPLFRCGVCHAENFAFMSVSRIAGSIGSSILGASGSGALSNSLILLVSVVMYDCAPVMGLRVPIPWRPLYSRHHR
jgi:hypothetical protein